MKEIGAKGDHPISRPEDDSIGRNTSAINFAHQILSLDASEGLVVGVLGPWGSGKTSYVNLAGVEIERQRIPLLAFNPWMFSGAEQLVESFFVELASQLRLRNDLSGIGKKLEDYGEAFSGVSWLPIVGPWIERGRTATNVIAKMLQRRKEGSGARRIELEKALRKLASPILVVLDDIDRLLTTQIRDVFKLVRLTAKLPNLIYIVAFDRLRVERALDEQGISGRDYLEKILEVVVDLPAIRPEVLIRQIFDGLDKTLATIPKHGPFDESAWADIFGEIVRPLIRNMRDVRRYVAGALGTVAALALTTDLSSDASVQLIAAPRLDAVTLMLALAPMPVLQWCGYPLKSARSPSAFRSRTPMVPHHQLSVFRMETIS